MAKKSANEIDVKAFHHTLLWPLIMREPRNDQGSERSIESFVRALTEAGWSEQGTNSNEVHADYIYEEIVYFHPFVRDFLFGDGKQGHDKRTIRRLTRSDIDDVAIEFGQQSGDFSITLKVERVEMLLIRPRIAMLLVEVSNRKPDSAEPQESVTREPDPKLGDDRTKLTLDQAMYIQSRFRSIYPPYFEPNGLPCECAVKLKWGGSLSVPATMRVDSDADQFRAFVSKGAEPPLFAHWQTLFNKPDGTPAIRPLQSASDLAPGDESLYFQQLLDNRMPSMSFIAVENPDEIRLEDEDCFPAFDPSGFVYEEDFRDARRAQFRYTRFRHYGTTYYCNGTSFALVCNTFKDENGGVFSDLLLSHFRRHYTHIAVIAQYQHAALIRFADELADISREMAFDKGPELSEKFDWQEELKTMQHGFLKFRTRSFFTEVSNQIQGKDLFRFWSDQLGTPELFEWVSRTNSELYDSVENRELKRQTSVQTMLAEVATVGIVAGLFLTVVSAVFAGAALFPGAMPVWWTVGGVGMAAICSFGFWRWAQDKIRLANDGEARCRNE